MFWGSGVLKEGIILTGMGLLLWSFDKVINKSLNWKNIVILIFSFILVRYTKFYVALSLLPLMLALLWVKYCNYKKIFLKFITTTILFIFSAYIFNCFMPGMDIFAELARKQRDFIGLANSVNSGSLINVTTLKPNLWSLITNSPQALYNVLFRPWFFESSSLLMLAASLENLLFILFTVIAIIFFKKPDKKQTALVCFSFIFVLEIYILAGLTTPVVGAFVRYKLPALPFLFTMLLAITDLDKLYFKIKRFIKFKFIDKLFIE